MTSSPILVSPQTSVLVAEYPMGATYGPRQLADFEWVWLLRGSAVWRTQNLGPDGLALAEQQLVLRPGQLVLAQPGTRDSFQWDTTTRSMHAYVHFRLDSSGELGDECSSWPKIRNTSSAPVLAGICDYLLELAGDESLEARRRSNEMLALLLDLFVRGPMPADPLNTSPHVAAAIEHVRAIWSSEGMRLVSVDELAAVTNVSSGHVFKLFRNEFGCGPAQALEMVRLGRAAVALQHTSATLAEIADLTGYTNPYHFSRRFTTLYGTRPGEFRRSQASVDPLWPIKQAGIGSIAYVLQET